MEHASENVSGTESVQAVYDVPEYEHVWSCEMAVIVTRETTFVNYVACLLEPGSLST
jgi:hypothetical protein